jgi:small GTP-binding protein
MIQKKVCMIGVFGTGKTSLVQQFVHSRFSEKYHSTVGVKIDRKTVDIDGETITLVLWDIAGKDADEDVPASYVKGAHGVIFVADLTRRLTWEQLPGLDRLVQVTAGPVPSVVALNKSDIPEQWEFRADDQKAISAQWDTINTSARTGQGVEEVFQRITRAMLAAPGATT